MKKILTTSGLLLAMGSALMAGELGLNRHYTSDMVLQRDKPVLIRGFAEKGAKVTVTFSGQTKEATTNENGEWSATLDPMPASAEGRELRCQMLGVSDLIVLKNVVVGDVLMFARQTTIDVSLGRDEAGKKAATALPSVRVIRIQTLPAYDPQPDLAEGATSGWSALSKDEALKMDAAAFYLVKDLTNTTDVPIGVIDLNLGEHFPIAWMSKDALLETSSDASEAEMKDIQQIKSVIASMVEARQAFEAPTEKQQTKNAQRGYPRSPAKEDPTHPAVGYNAVLHPMRGLAIKALLLQLGNDYPYSPYSKIEREGKGTSQPHLGQAYEDSYNIRKLSLYLAPSTTPRIPKQWRKVFGEETLPVGWITPPGSELVTLGRHHYEVRELQRQAAEKENGVDLILPGTESIPFSAQPADDALLAARCLSWLKGAVYKQEGVPATGPVFDRVEIDGSTAQIFFKPGTAQGLTAATAALDTFEVIGEKLEPKEGEDPEAAVEPEYTFAKAVIDGETIRLSSDAVTKIAHIRYNWREKPDQGLTNADGLPAIPFNTDGHEFPSRINAMGENALPPEFMKSMAEWNLEGPVIYDGDLETGYTRGDFLGATGLLVTPAYGRNLFVNNAFAGSPADGKILHGDFLYGVNGKPFGDNMFAEVAEAITHAETEKAQGKLSFNLMRNNKQMTVDLQLEVLGTFSETAPYNCPKTDRIVANAEAYLAKFGGTTGGLGRASGHPVFTNPEAMFLLAAGSPEYQGLARRHVYNRMAIRDLSEPIDPNGTSKIGGPWDLSADMLLLSEYYLATGDKNVLPYLRFICDALTAIQIKSPEEKGPWPEVQIGQTGGWRHNYYGNPNYGTMPAVSVPAALGYHLTKEAGVKFDTTGGERAAGWFLHNGAKIGSIVYGYFTEPRTSRKKPLDPKEIAAGMLNPGNGGVAGAAILFQLRGDEEVSKTCSFVATHCYNNTSYAHGGHFWLNLYTPLGAKVDGKESFQLYMKGNRNYQELHRMHNYSRQQGSDFGVGQYLAYVAPRERLRILGAHESVFAANSPAALKAALAAFDARDYAACEKAVGAVIAKGVLQGLDLQQAEQLRDAAILMQRSIAHDLARVQKLIRENKPYEASLDLTQLKAVMPDGNTDLAAIEATLQSKEMKTRYSDDQKRYQAYLTSLVLELPVPSEKTAEDGPVWRELVSQGSYKPRGSLKANNPLPEPTIWRMKVVESINQAPEGWTASQFDDSTWGKTVLPLNWRENHTALFRGPFEIADPGKVKALRFNQFAKHLSDIEVSINGQVVATITAVSGGRTNAVPLNDHALKLLKKGRNVLAVTYRNHLRWGSYFKGADSASAGGLNVTLEVQER